MQVTRTRNPRGQGDRLRTELLEAATELLAEHGSIDRVSLRAVASRAGVSPTAVYRHFEDHSQLMETAIDWCWEEFIRAIEVGSDDHPDPFDRFVHMGQRYVSFAMNESGKYRVMFSNQIDPTARKGPTAMSAFGLLVELVDEMLSANGDDRDPFFVSTQVHTWIHGMVHMCGNHPELPFPSVDELLIDLPARMGLTRDA